MTKDITLPTIENILSGTEPAMEGLEGFKELTSVFGKKVRWLLQLINNTHGASPVRTSRDVSKAVNLIDRAGMAHLERFTVPVPEGLVGAMVPYLESILVAMKTLVNVKARALNPLGLWAGNIITDDTYGSKVWINANVDNINVKPLLKDIAKHYDDRAGDDIDRLTLHVVYPKIKDITKAASLLSELNELSLAIMNDRLEESATELSALFSKINEDSETKLADSDPKLMRVVSNSLYATGLELETLAVLVFQVRTAVNAYNLSITKITDQLA